MLEWITYEDHGLEDDPECKNLLAETFDLIMDQGYFLEGPAGGGKSTYEKMVLHRAHTERSKSFLCMGPTHTSCRQMTVEDLKDAEGEDYEQEARTVVHVAKRKPVFKTWKVRRVKEDIHSFDEWFNTQQPYAMNFPMKAQEANPDLRFHICGDYRHLGPHRAPVGMTERYRSSCVLWKLAGGTPTRPALCVRLTQPRRMERPLFDVCMNVASGNYVDMCRAFPFKGWTLVNLALPHPFRKAINSKLMHAFRKADSLFVEKTRNPLTQDCILTRKMPLVGRDTGRKQGIYNASMYTLIDWQINIPESPENPTLIIRDRYNDAAELIKVSLADFHQWFRPGYCVTIDSSQGRTIRERYTIWEIRHPFMSAPRRYVGTSRGTRKRDVQAADCAIMDLQFEAVKITL